MLTQKLRSIWVVGNQERKNISNHHNYSHNFYSNKHRHLPIISIFIVSSIYSYCKTMHSSFAQYVYETLASIGSSLLIVQMFMSDYIVNMISRALLYKKKPI